MSFNIYKWRRDQLLIENENPSSVITKKIKDLTWEDVDGLALPTKTSGVLRAMKATKDLDSWKSEFKGNELELEVTVDKDADMWFNKVKIEKLTQSDPMGFQAKKDIEKGKRFGLDEIEGDPDDYYGYNEPIDPNDYADGYDDEENQLADIINNNKAALAKQFNLVNPMVSWNAEGEPVMMTDDNDEQVDFIKVEDWEDNKGFYNRNNGIGKITLNGIDIIYVVNPF